MVVNPEKLTLKAAVAYYPECGQSAASWRFRC